MNLPSKGVLEDCFCKRETSNHKTSVRVRRGSGVTDSTLVA